MKVAIVTGSSRGIGAACARALAKDHKVIVNYSRDAKAAEALAAEIGGIAVKADVSSEAEVAAMFARFDEIAVLVNNAGVTGGFARVEEVSAASIDSVLAINVKGTILCCREALKRMKHGASIVNIGSLAARTGGAGDWVHYAASKAAVHAFTIGLGREVGARGIRVNCVAPGLIETELHARSGQPDRLKKLAPQIPMRRAGLAQEVANAVAWLASSESSYVTASIVEVGGGR